LRRRPLFTKEQRQLPLQERKENRKQSQKDKVPLPLEIWAHILEYALPKSNYVNLALVSKSFKLLMKPHLEIWKKYNAELMGSLFFIAETKLYKKRGLCHYSHLLLKKNAIYLESLCNFLQWVNDAKSKRQPGSLSSYNHPPMKPKDAELLREQLQDFQADVSDEVAEGLKDVDDILYEWTLPNWRPYSNLKAEKLPRRWYQMAAQHQNIGLKIK